MAQIITFDHRERLTEEECEVGHFVLAGGEAWDHPPGRIIRRDIRVPRQRADSAGLLWYEEMSFERWWTSEERAIYCWWRVK